MRNLATIIKLHKVGFTLVELSIVLVAIGLIIGGILIGATLIQSAKINAVVKEVTQYNIAIDQFKLKYRGIPGDTSKVAPPSQTNSASIADNGVISDYEGRSLFWPQLQGTILPGLKTIQILDNAGNKQCPQSIWAKDTAICMTNMGVYAYTLPVDPGSTYPAGSYFYIGKTNNTRGFSVMQSMALDSKMDDGKPRAGNVYFEGNNCATGNSGYYSWNQSDVSDDSCTPFMFYKFMAPVGWTDPY